MKQRVRSFCSNGEILKQRVRSSTNREIVEQRRHFAAVEK